MYKSLFGLFILLCFTCCLSWAQQVSFTTAVSATRIGTNDQLQVTYAIEGAAKPTGISNPNFGSFKLLSGPMTSTSSSTVINGNNIKQTTTYSYIYILQPTRAGRFTLPALFLKTPNGETYKSQQVSVEVIQGSVVQQRPAPGSDPFGHDDFEDMLNAMHRQQQQMLNAYRNQIRQQQQQRQEAINDYLQPDKNLILRVEADKNQVYLGQQITATYKLYARVPMQMSISKLPMLKGFWAHDFKLPKELKPVREVYNGREYEVFTLKKSALFPQEVGTLTLDAAEAEGIAQQYVAAPQSQDPFGFDDPFFGGGGVQVREVPVRLSSKPLSITVKPLPNNGRPKDFNGAVGRYTQSIELDKTQATTDEVLTLTLTLSGSGNLKLITPSKLALPAGLTTLDPVVTDTFNASGNLISGKKIITYTLTPTEPGVYKIPAIPFSYFDPEDGTYHTQLSPVLEVSIAKGSHYEAQHLKQKKAPSNHLQPILTGALPDAHKAQAIWIQQLWYWLLFALPILALSGIFISHKIGRHRMANPQHYRLKAANTIALRRLKTAKKFLAQSQKDLFYEELAKALWLYLSDKLHLPLATLSKEKVLTAMSEAGMADHLIADVNALADAAATTLYAPNEPGAMQRDYQQALALISNLELAFKQQLKTSLRKPTLSILIALLVFSHKAPAQTVELHWQNGIAAYQQKDYTKATQSFKEASLLQPRNASIHYNLGNALFHSKDFVQASLAYKRVLLYNPQDDAAYHNLEIAQSNIPGVKPFQNPTALIYFFEKITQRRWSNAWAISALAFMLLACLMIAQKLRGRLTYAFALQTIIALIALCGFSLGLAFTASHNAQGAHDAVMLQPATIVAHIGDEKNVAALPAGTIITIHHIKDTMAEVTTADGQHGWLSTGTFEKVLP